MAYHHFLHIVNPLFRAKAYMTFFILSCVVIRWPPNEQRARCMPDAFNPCPHSHVRRLDAKGWIKPKRKHNVEVKVKCVMWNEHIDGLTTNHNPTPLLEQEWMRALDVGKTESSSKIYLKDVSWWMSIKDAYRLGVSIIAKLSKERCILLSMGGRLFRITQRHDWRRCGPPST
jgi:hypothetical protein